MTPTQKEEPNHLHFVGESLYTDKPFCEVCGERPKLQKDKNNKIVSWEWKEKIDK